MQSVEDLTDAGYLVLTAEQAEAVAALLGEVAFGGGEAAQRATKILVGFPEPQ